MIRTTLSLSLAVLMMLGALTTGLDARILKDKSQRDNERFVMLPSTTTLDWMSFGYRTFLTDLLWVRGLQLRMEQISVEVVEQYARSMIHLDPEFTHAYRWGAVSLIFAGGETSAEGVVAANEILTLGMEHFPNEPYFPHSIGLNWAFYYPTNTDAEKDAMKAKGARFLQLALERPNPPQDTAILAASLLVEDNSAEMVDFLERAYTAESDPTIRRRIARRLGRVSSDERRRIFEQQRRERALWHENSGYDFLPIALVYVLGNHNTGGLPAHLPSLAK